MCRKAPIDNHVVVEPLSRLLDGKFHVLFHQRQGAKVMHLDVAHHVLLSLHQQQNKKNLVIVSQAVVAAVVIEGAVNARGGRAMWCFIALALAVSGAFDQNAKKDGHSGVPLMHLTSVFALQCLFMVVSNKMIAVVLVSD